VEGVDHIDFIVRGRLEPRHPDNITLLFATPCLLAQRTRLKSS
jgi:hypothetical protein